MRTGARDTLHVAGAAAPSPHSSLETCTGVRTPARTMGSRAREGRARSVAQLDTSVQDPHAFPTFPTGGSWAPANPGVSNYVVTVLLYFCLWKTLKC